jgi:ABC-2 type transport system ATP-binding protein
MEKTFGGFMAECRMRKGLTQKQLADKLFIGESAVSRYEADKRQPDFELVKKISEILGITEGELLNAGFDEKAICGWCDASTKIKSAMGKPVENPTAVLKTRNLTKKYGAITAVDGVSMTINKGDIYGFIGANGAGKTTFIRMIMGLASPTGGDFEILGAGCDGKGIEGARKKIGCIVETPALQTNMTAFDCLRCHGLLYGVRDDRKIKDLLGLVGLANTNKKKVADFSLGMKQRLALAQALVNDPEILILDEPTNGLDPQGIIEIRHLLLKFASQNGLTILISSHILAELSQLATRFGIIKDGKLIDEFRTKDIGKKPLEQYYMQVVGGF